MRTKNESQKTIVEDTLKEHAASRLTFTTERVYIPGIETMHLKPIEEVAGVIANLIKSRANLTVLTFHVGKFIEITSQSDLSID